MSTATIELSSTRQKLFEALGDTQGAYIAHMKQWFRKKSTKEEFDQAARKLLSKVWVFGLHNQQMQMSELYFNSNTLYLHSWCVFMHDIVGTDQLQV